MTARLTLLLVATMVVGAIAAGCGSSADSADSNTDITASSIPKAQFIKQVSAICSGGLQRIALRIIAFRKQHSDAAENDAVEAAKRAIFLSGIQDQVDEIHRLGAPRGDVGQIEAFVTSLLHAAEEIEERELTTNAEYQRLLRPVGDEALKYGLKGCAYGY